MQTEMFSSVNAHHRPNNGAQRKEASGGGAGHSWTTLISIKRAGRRATVRLLTQKAEKQFPKVVYSDIRFT